MDLIVGRIYEAKKPAAVGYGQINDRQIVWMDCLGMQVQYDSPSVRMGSRLPSVSRDKFLAWAGRDITDEMPKGQWRQRT